MSSETVRDRMSRAGLTIVPVVPRRHAPPPPINC